MFSQRPRCHYNFSCLRASVITIEGGIGVGKTSLGRSIERFLNKLGIKTKFFPEYVNQTLLTQFIGDMKRYAYSFELFMLAKRAEIYRDAQRFADLGGLAIIDRSINGDWAFTKMQYDAGRITAEDWKTYQDILKAENFYEPSLTIFLDCSIDKSMERINKRGRDGESGYTLSYLCKLRTAYAESFDQVKHEIHYLEWSENRTLDDNGYLLDDDVEEFLNDIRNNLVL